MIVGVLKVEVYVADACSLKDKRRVVGSIKQRLRDRFNVSVEEVDHQDAHRRCALGIAIVSKESRSLQSRLDKIIEMIQAKPGLEIIEIERDSW